MHDKHILVKIRVLFIWVIQSKVFVTFTIDYVVRIIFLDYAIQAYKHVFVDESC